MSSPVEGKVCKSCNEFKPPSAYHKNGGRGLGLRARCKTCLYVQTSEYRKANPDLYRQAQIKKYGITVAEYDAMHEAQGGVCLLCSGPPTRGDTWLCVDHCHVTGRVRGLLCSNCNSVLGYVNDNVTVLRRMVDYLGMN